MPLFEYRCPMCGATRELFRPAWAKSDREWLPSCVADPNCLGTVMDRVFTPPAIRGATVSRP